MGCALAPEAGLLCTCSSGSAASSVVLPANKNAGFAPAVGPLALKTTDETSSASQIAQRELLSFQAVEVSYLRFEHVLHQQENKGRWQSGTVLATIKGWPVRIGQDPKEARCTWKVQQKMDTTCIPLSLFSWLAWVSGQFWHLS
jgi:hypothetical protein